MKASVVGKDFAIRIFEGELAAAIAGAAGSEMSTMCIGPNIPGTTAREPKSAMPAP